MKSDPKMDFDLDKLEDEANEVKRKLEVFVEWSIHYRNIKRIERKFEFCRYILMLDRTTYQHYQTDIQSKQYYLHGYKPLKVYSHQR